MVLKKDEARIIHSRDWQSADAVSGAIQVGPRLVVDGAPLKLKPALRAARRWRSRRDGRALTLVIVDGPIDANELAARLAAAGFDTALMLDGGPSTQLSLALGDTQSNIPGAYPVPDLLAIIKTPSPQGPVVPTQVDLASRPPLPG